MAFQKVEEGDGEKSGASEGIRTLDTHVGNVMLYQAELRSLPEGPFTLRFLIRNASSSFGTKHRRCRPEFVSPAANSVKNVSGYFEAGVGAVAGEDWASLLWVTL